MLLKMVDRKVKVVIDNELMILWVIGVFIALVLRVLVG
jgi:beta-lactamase regulating signal transducer with metallopeptidase domain